MIFGKKVLTLCAQTVNQQPLNVTEYQPKGSTGVQ